MNELRSQMDPRTNGTNIWTDRRSQGFRTTQLCSVSIEQKFRISLFNKMDQNPLVDYGRQLLSMMLPPPCPAEVSLVHNTALRLNPEIWFGSVGLNTISSEPESGLRLGSTQTTGTNPFGFLSEYRIRISSDPVLDQNHL